MPSNAQNVSNFITYFVAHEGKSGLTLIVLRISAFVLILTVPEMLGKSAQTNGLGLKIAAMVTWSCFHVRPIRQTSLPASTAALMLQADNPDSDGREQILCWQARIGRWDNAYTTKEGRKDLIDKANGIQAKRVCGFQQYQGYEVASLLIQLGGAALVTLFTSAMFFAGRSGFHGEPGLETMLRE